MSPCLCDPRCPGAGHAFECAGREPEGPGGGWAVLQGGPGEALHRPEGDRSWKLRSSLLRESFARFEMRMVHKLLLHVVEFFCKFQFVFFHILMSVICLFVLNNVMIMRMLVWTRVGAGNSCRRGGMKEAECQCQACWMKSCVYWLNIWKSGGSLWDEAGWHWQQSVINVCGWIFVMKIRVDFLFASCLNQAHDIRTNEVVAIKKMSYSGKQSNEVRTWQPSHPAPALHLTLVVFAHLLLLLEMAGHHQGSKVPPEAAPPQHSGVSWLLPERTHSMGESHTVQVFQHR